MQTGFAMREVGAVCQENTKTVLLKNVLNASIGCIIWATCGYGLSMGTTSHQIYGKDHFFLTKDAFSDGTGNHYASWLFQWVRMAVFVSFCMRHLSTGELFTSHAQYIILY
jgi:ammonia channel protein AmtB